MKQLIEELNRTREYIGDLNEVYEFNRRDATLMDWADTLWENWPHILAALKAAALSKYKEAVQE